MSVSKGSYNITLKLKTKMKNCSQMFKGCKYITNIDLSLFDSSSVNNMSEMFKVVLI